MGVHSVTSTLAYYAYFAITFVPRAVLRGINRLIVRTTHDRPMHDCADYGWIPEVEALYPAIRAEVDQMIRFVDDLPTNHETLPTSEYYFADRKWHHMGLHVYGAWIEDNCALYPKTREALTRIKGLVAGGISILPPGESVPDHIHSYKGMLIYHLGVRVPSEPGACGMRVADHTIAWKEGGSLVFDPMFSHETWNRSDEYRALLLVEFQRPDLIPVLRGFTWLFIRVWRYTLGVKQLREFNTRAAAHRHHIESLHESPAAVLPGT